jgi:alpha-beta hydrolase superfamily lysophospholipase
MTVERSEHQLRTHDGVTISLDRWHQDGRDAVLILCPGFFQSKDTATFRRMSETLAAGRDVLSMDFRGHGRSGGFYTFSAREGADLEAVLDWARGRYARIGIVGFSMGGAIAINTVGRHQDQVQSVIVVSAPCAFEEIEFQFWTPEAMRTGLQGLEPGAGCRPGSPLLEKARPLDTIKAFRALPVLLIHGTNDMIVGVRHSHRLYAAAPEPKRLAIIEGGSHAEALFRDDPQGFIEQVNTWLTRTLPVSG